MPSFPIIVGAAVALAATSAYSNANERVRFTSTDAAGTLISAHLVRATDTATSRTPAIVALHGCGGLYSAREPAQLSPRHADWADRWARAGYTVLFPDSFGSRGAGSLCKIKDRGITPRIRAHDAFGAAAWLAQQPTIDAGRIVLVGWSNGGSTALRANDSRFKPAVDFSAIIAFYPGCRTFVEQPWQPRRPLTMLVGAEDDWTPAAPCQALAEKGGAAIITYPNAYHDFDAPGMPLRVRTGLAFTGSGTGIAHAGTNPAARTAAISDVTKILADAFK